MVMRALLLRGQAGRVGLQGGRPRSLEALVLSAPHFDLRHARSSLRGPGWLLPGLLAEFWALSHAGADLRCARQVVPRQVPDFRELSFPGAHC